MLIKRGKIDIVEVVADEDHNIDDLGTREALEKAKEKIRKTSEDKKAKATTILEN